MITNHEIAVRFGEIADALEILGESKFKVIAYRRAVDTINDLEDSLADIDARGALSDIPGFGEAITAKTQDFLAKGTTKLYDEIKGKVPAGVRQMARIPGIGPKTVKSLWDGLGVTTVAELEQAAKDEKIRVLAGFGPGKEKNILEAIERGRRLAERLPLYIALPYAERIAAQLRKRPEVSRVELAGSLRRRRTARCRS